MADRLEGAIYEREAMVAWARDYARRRKMDDGPLLRQVEYHERKAIRRAGGCPTCQRRSATCRCGR